MNAFSELFSRPDTAKCGIIEFEDGEIEITVFKHKEKDGGGVGTRTEHQRLQDNIKLSLMHVIRVPEREEREKRHRNYPFIEEIFEEMIAEKFSENDERHHKTINLKIPEHLK